MAQKQIKRVYRSRDNRIIAGVLGGIGEYLEIDPVLIRLIFVGITIATGIIPGIIFYILALFIIPERPR